MQRKEADAKSGESRIEKLKEGIKMIQDNQAAWEKDMKSVSEKLRATDMQIKRTDRDLRQREALSRSTQGVSQSSLL